MLGIIRWFAAYATPTTVFTHWFVFRYSHSFTYTHTHPPATPLDGHKYVRLWPTRWYLLFYLSNGDNATGHVCTSLKTVQCQYTAQYKMKILSTDLLNARHGIRGRFGSTFSCSFFLVLMDLWLHESRATHTHTQTHRIQRPSSSSLAHKTRVGNIFLTLN